MQDATEAEALPEHVTLYVDDVPYKSPNPTTGELLYRLSQTPHGRQLYREVEGQSDDELISRCNQPVRVHPSDRFYSTTECETATTVIVNGRKKTVRSRKLTFRELLALAFDPVPTGPNFEFTASYRNGPHSNPEGRLRDGQTIRIKEGMIFNVTATDKS